jgi:hypothetical protein
MAARRSFARSISKFQPEATKPAAIMTGFRAKHPHADNQAANAELCDDLQQLNLSFYAVRGMGQEDRRAFFGLLLWVAPSTEESFVVQPRGDLPEEEFVAAIKNLVQKYGQLGAGVKLPSITQAFVLRQDGTRDNIGSTVGARTVRDTYFTQLRGGPRADRDMLSAWEIWGERHLIKRVVNWWSGRSFMNEPADRSKIGRRFSIKPGGVEA